MKSTTVKAGIIVILALIVFGCSGGSGLLTAANSGIGGTGVVSSGPITGFGSIFVNGVEYQTDSAAVEFDDASGSVTELKLGMRVKVEAIENRGIFNATKVLFDYEVKGPVTSLVTSTDGLSKQFTVLGTRVSVDQTATVFDNSAGFSFASLAENQLVKISGLFDQNGVLVANYIELGGNFVVGTSEVELKGVISNLSGTCFILGSMTVDASSANLIGLPNGLTDNAQVEVKGVLANGTTVTATLVRSEQGDLEGVEGQVELSGFVTDFTRLASFKVAGQQVNADSATLIPAGTSLTNGSKVEVEGALSNGVLVAVLVQHEQEDLKIHGQVTALTNSSKQASITVGTDTIAVTSDASTLFEDETNSVAQMSYSDLAIGDFVEIRASKVNSDILASVIRRTGVGEHLIEGAMDSISSSSVSVLGVSFALVNGTTVYKNSADQSVTQANFITLVTAGSQIKVKDNFIADGVADELELEN